MINRVLCLDWLENELPDKCAKLIIMDPPYFEVKGKFKKCLVITEEKLG